MLVVSNFSAYGRGIERGCLLQKETFIKQYAAGLNPQQLAAVQAVHGPVLLLAGQRQNHRAGDPFGLHGAVLRCAPGADLNDDLHGGRHPRDARPLCRPFWGGACRADDLPHH